MKKIMLIYPTGEIYQRGEDRCQINVESSVSNSLRACNDLGYVASILKDKYKVFLKDYPAEKLAYEDFKNDFIKFSPDVVFISVTNGSIFNDVNFANKIKDIKSDSIVIFKGALFFNIENDFFNEINLENVDYLIGGEVEFIISALLNAHFNNKLELENIAGISYKQNETWITNKVFDFNKNIDEIPFPDRSIMNNALYINPQTNKPIATISTSRGCPSSCIYCLSPIISGKQVRYRTPENILLEIKECVEIHKISDFFFKSDTFTINKQWVIELCNLIIESGLAKKINWVANSKVNTLDEEILLKMKEAGCSMIALGLESGSEESLAKMKKGTTLTQNILAVKLIKKVGLKIFGFYLIGFPWENKKHLTETKKLMFQLDTDFIELSIATPFKGSELYNILKEKTENGRIVLGKDSFKYTTLGTDYITKEELEAFRKKTILEYHTRPKYILKKLFDKELTFELFLNYVKYGFRILKNTIIK